MGLIVFGIIVVVVIIFIALANNEDSTSSHNYSAPVTNNPSAISNYSSYDDIRVVGGFYRSYEAKQFIRTLSSGDEVYFLPEPSNPYDRNAVMVISSTGLHIGYIERVYAEDIKLELKNNDLRGWVCGEAESSYEFDISVDQQCDVEEKEKALLLYINNSSKRAEMKNSQDKRIALNFYDKLNKAEKMYFQKKYDKVKLILEPFFQQGIQNRTCYELMIKTLHVERNYEEEEKMIDEYLQINDHADKTYWKRRKFHILRQIGVIVSDEQIDNEKAGVETTILELDAFSLVVDLLSEIVDPNRIDFRDSQSLFAVNLDGNIRKPICKFYFNNRSKMSIGLIEPDKSILKVEMNSLDDIKDCSEQLCNAVLNYL